jgi:hypothetical protein
LWQKTVKIASKDHARGRWLPADKGIGTLALENGDELVFKVGWHFKKGGGLGGSNSDRRPPFQSTNRPVKVVMPDGATKV